MKSLRTTCGPLISIHWRNWVGSVHPVLITYHKHLHPTPQTKENQTVFLEAQTFFLSSVPMASLKLPDFRRAAVQTDKLLTLSWGVSGPSCQSEVWCQPQASDGVCGVVSNCPGAVTRVSCSVFCVSGCQPPHACLHSTSFVYSSSSYDTQS